MKNFILASSLFYLSSCGTIFTGTKQKITFQSNMDGKVYQNLTEIGKTNQQLKVKRKDLVKLYTIKTDVCGEKQFELPIKTNAVVFLDIPFAFLGYGLIWSYIDAVNGAGMKTKKTIVIDFDCKVKKQ